MGPCMCVAVGTTVVSIVGMSTSLLNVMLLHTPSHMHDRFTLTSTEAREEARNIKPDKTKAWKSRRKKTNRQMLSVASGTTGPGDRYYHPAALPPYALCHRW